MSDYVVWTFDAAKIGMIVASVITAVTIGTQFIKKAIEWFGSHADPDSRIGKLCDLLSHKYGPVLLSALVSTLPFIVKLQDIVADGKLVTSELSTILSWFGVTVGANVLYLITRYLAFTKKE